MRMYMKGASKTSPSIIQLALSCDILIALAKGHWVRVNMSIITWMIRSSFIRWGGDCFEPIHIGVFMTVSDFSWGFVFVPLPLDFNNVCGITCRAFQSSGTGSERQHVQTSPYFVYPSKSSIICTDMVHCFNQ